MGRSSVFGEGHAGLVPFSAVVLAVTVAVLALSRACAADAAPAQSMLISIREPDPSVPPSVAPLATCGTILRAMPAGIFATPVLADGRGGDDLPHMSLRNCMIVDGTVFPLGDHAVIEMQRLRKEGDGSAMAESLNRSVTNFVRDGCGAAAAAAPADPAGLYHCSSVQPNPAVTGIAALTSGDRWVGVRVIFMRSDDASRRKVEEAAVAIARAVTGT